MDALGGLEQLGTDFLAGDVASLCADLLLVVGKIDVDFS